MRVAVIAGELIDANVRLRLTANRTYEITAPKSTVCMEMVFT